MYRAASAVSVCFNGVEGSLYCSRCVCVRIQRFFALLSVAVIVESLFEIVTMYDDADISYFS
jgi:hypothetical protein